MKKFCVDVKDIHNLDKWQCAATLYKYFKIHSEDFTMEEKIIFTLYYWYGVKEFIPFKILKKILRNKDLNINNKNIKNIKKYGCFHCYDEGIFLKTWPSKGQKIIPRNFVRELDGMETFHQFNNEIKNLKGASVITYLLNI